MNAHLPSSLAARTAAPGATHTTAGQRLRTLLRRPTFLGALVVVAALAIVWGAMLFSASQPQSLDQRATSVENQLLLPGGDGETLTNAAGPQADLMRQVVHEQLAAGRSEQQVLAYMEQHYGEGILAVPPFNGFTLLIWVVPGLMLLVGAGVAVSAARAWRPTEARLAAASGASGRAGATATRQPQATPAAEVNTEEMSATEQARWRALLEREMAAEEGLSPHSVDATSQSTTRSTHGKGEGA